MNLISTTKRFPSIPNQRHHAKENLIRRSRKWTPMVLFELSRMVAYARLADEAKTTQAEVKDKQGIDGQPDPVLDNTTPTEYADSGSQ